MPDSHKNSKRPPESKQRHRVINWADYEAGLRLRGDITVWFSEEAIENWKPAPTGKRGAQQKYSDLAIETGLTLRLIFHLPLRQTEGFLGSVVSMLGLELDIPDHTTFSRRGRTFRLSRPLAELADGPVDIIVDSTGLKLRGPGEWHVAKHGDKKRRIWKKLHIAVDGPGKVRATVVTDGHASDATQVPGLLDQITDPIERFIADGAYDRTPVYEAVRQHSPKAQLIVPPRKDAVLSGNSTEAPTQRDLHIEAIKRDGRLKWKYSSGYFEQSRVENTFFRYKTIFGDSFRARLDAGQANEGALGALILNRMRALGTPSTTRIH